MTDFDVAELAGAFNLPDFPDTEEERGEESRVLVLFRFQDDGVILAGPVTLEDAQAYCQREDTSGDGWFVGYNRAFDYEPGEIY